MRIKGRTVAVGDVVLVLGFFACLSLPLAGLVSRLEKPHAFGENRAPAPAPRRPQTWREVGGLQRKIEAYWNDRFGFRRTLIGLNSLASLALGVSPLDQVILGKSRWLFLDEEVPYRKGPPPPVSEEQLATWRRELEARRDWLAARGAHYLFVVAPNKSSIYPEYLPRALTPPPGPTELDRFIAYMQARSDVDVLDLRPALWAAKAGQPVYHQADTHWNSTGAYVAYAAIVERLAARWFPGMTAPPLSAYSPVAPRRAASGDLARMFALPERFPHDGFTLRPRDGRRARPTGTRLALPAGQIAPVATERPDLNGPRALVFHDSFGRRLIPYLSEHWGRAVYVRRSDFDAAAVDEEHPDLVIHQVVERFLRLGLVPAALPQRP
jgi:alginate O-acetyltransferase complex protein AlgJ